MIRTILTIAILLTACTDKSAPTTLEEAVTDISSGFCNRLAECGALDDAQECIDYNAEALCSYFTRDCTDELSDDDMSNLDSCLEGLGEMSCSEQIVPPVCYEVINL